MVVFVQSLYTKINTVVRCCWKWPAEKPVRMALNSHLHIPSMGVVTETGLCFMLPSLKWLSIAVAIRQLALTVTLTLVPSIGHLR